MASIRSDNRLLGMLAAATRRLAGVSKPGLLVAAVLAIVGAVWLVGWSGKAEGVAVLDQPLSEQRLAACRELLDSRAIAYDVRDGQLVAEAKDAGRIRAALAGEGLLGADHGDQFERLAGENDLWRTAEQNAKRWQAAKMAALSRMIGKFPQIDAAEVIFEPGRPRRLGSPAVAATAAVKVALVAGEQMTAGLAEGIADLVCGSVTGMARADVRIVDSQGRSHSAAPAEAASGSGAAIHARAEARFTEKIQSLLSHTGRSLVTVGFRSDGDGPASVTACVTVPRSHLVAVYETIHGRGGTVNDDAFNAIAAAELARLHRIVTSAIGAEDQAAVTVDWYFDTPAAFQAADASSTSATAGRVWVTAVVAGAAGIAVAAAAWVLIGLRRRVGRRRAVLAERRRRQHQAIAGKTRQGGLGRFGFLRDVPVELLVEAVGQEHPKTIALALAHVSPTKAAAALRSLSPESQAEVVARLAGSRDTGEHVLQEVADGLAARLRQLVADRQDRSGQTRRVVEILRHAGYQTEQAVLAGLGDGRAHLADAIQDGMFAFEDIAKLPVEHLRGAIAKVDCEELAVALRTASRAVSKKVFASLPRSAGKRVRREMERIGPVRLSDVEACQRQVVATLRQGGLGVYESAADQPSRRLPAHAATEEQTWPE